MAKTKKGPLSQKEKSYVSKNYKAKSVAVMAEHLKRSEYMVDKFVKTLSFENTEEVSKPSATQPAEQKQPTSDHLFAKNEDRGVVVMTQAASMAADESKAKRKEATNEIVPRYKKYIHKIKD